MDTGVIEKGWGVGHGHGEGVVTDTGVIDTRGVVMDTGVTVTQEVMVIGLGTR